MMWNINAEFLFDTKLLNRTLVFSVLFVVLYVAAALVNKRRKYVAIVNKIPGPPTISPLGNIGLLGVYGLKKGKVPLLAEVFQRVTGLAKIYGSEGLARLWLAHEPGITITKYEMAEYILNSNSLINKSKDYNLLHTWLGTGLLTSTGLKWKQRRKLLTPAFHFRMLEDSLEVMNDKSQILTTKLASLVDKEWVNIVPFIALCALDIISETAMGVAINAQKDTDSPYIKSIHKVSSIIIDRGAKVWLWNDFIFSLTSTGKIYNKCLKLLHEVTRKVIREKKAVFKATEDPQINNETVKRKRLAFLDILLNEHMTTGAITEEDIREEVDTFLFEGHDTTAVGMSWALYLIGLYPAVQLKVAEELETIFGDDTNRPVTYEDLKEMKYLECVLKESLRLYPSIPYVGRTVTEDTKFGNYIVPKGSRMWIFFYVIHRDPRVFDDPEEFIPERFLPENFKGKHPFSFIPFSAGPRNCIGQKFALMEEKTVIANILRNFTIKSVDPRDKVVPSAEIVLRPVNGIRMRITPRKYV